MAKLLYVEPTDEITDLVDRIRRAEGDRDLVFVVPPDGRALRSSLDLQLLLQYTRGFQKRVSIVSSDAQVQALAIRAGFPTFTTLSQLEQGVSLRSAPTAAAVAAGTAVAAAAPPDAPPSPNTGLARRAPSQLVARPAEPSGQRRLSAWWHSPRGRNWMIGSGAAVFVIGVLAVLFLLPSATILVGVQSHRINDSVTIQGTLSGQSSGVLDVIPTEALLTPAATQTFTVSPSGTQVLPPTPATGSLYLCYTGGGGGGGSISLSFAGSGAEFQVSGGSGNVGFTPTSSGANGTYTVQHCQGGQGASSQTSTPPLPVQADSNSLGSQGNVAAGQQWNWTNASSTACIDGICPPFSGSFPFSFSLANPSPMSGGQDSKTEQVFTSSDISAAQQQQQTIDSNLTSQVEKTLKTMAGHDVIAQDSSGNGIQLTVTNPTLPTVGQAGQTETLTVSVTAAASAYSPSTARAAVLQDLKSKVPADGELLAHPNLGTIEVVAAGPGGTLTLSSNAVGYWAPKVDLAPYRSRVTFMNPGSAKTYLLAQLPGASSVTIRQAPFALPWLPLISGRIQIERVSLRA
ncbi:MAG: hypothetical protein ACP5PW_05710 [Candidatus Dormibacteria bacterium]